MLTLRPHSPGCTTTPLVPSSPPTPAPLGDSRPPSPFPLPLPQARIELLNGIQAVHLVLKPHLGPEDMRMVLGWLDRFARYPMGAGEGTSVWSWASFRELIE